MDAPKYQQPATDPAFAALQKSSQQQDIDAIEAKAQGDTSSILARYGASLALAGTGGLAAMTGAKNSVGSSSWNGLDAKVA